METRDTNIPQGHPILIVASPGPGGLTTATFDAIKASTALARSMGFPMAAALIGDGVSGMTAELFEAGAQTVYLAEHQTLTNAPLDVAARVLRRIIEEAKPYVVLVPQTPASRELAPYLALSLGVAVVTNCTHLSHDAASGRLEARCPVMGGIAIATYQFEGDGLKVIGFQPQDVPSYPAPESAGGEVVIIDPEPDTPAPRTRVIDRRVSPGPKLEDARVIAAGGRGLGAKENYRHIEELAELLGGLPGASRAIVDLGWASPAQQVGLTGKTVSPDLYIAVGISGASQHMVGCSRSRTIVAVNSDRDSHIFPYARYGVVADCREFLPAFIDECRKLRMS